MYSVVPITILKLQHRRHFGGRLAQLVQVGIPGGLQRSLAVHLPGKYRAVIHLFYYEGYQTEEIARILGRSPSTVRAQLTRARQKLRTLLKEDI